MGGEGQQEEPEEPEADEIATGELMPNLGEKKFQAVSQEGVTRSITAQVRSKQSPDEREESDAGWQVSGV